MRVVLLQEKLADLTWLLKLIINTLNTSSRDAGQLFSFVPYYYVTLLLELCMGVRSHYRWEMDKADLTCKSLCVSS